MSIDTDVLHLIFLSEKIQDAVLKGDVVSCEEALFIRQCATELLQVVPAPVERDPSQFAIPF